MSETTNKLNILFIAENDLIQRWFIDIVSQQKLLWNLNFTEPLRIIAPDIKLQNYQKIFVHWQPLAPSALQGLIETISPKNRSPEGVLIELEENLAKDDIKKITVLGEDFSRSELNFIAEIGIKSVFAFPSKRNLWDAKIKEFLNKSDTDNSQVTDRIQESAYHYQQLAQIQFNAKNYQDASHLLEQALTKNPGYLAALQLLADTHIAQKNYASAMQILDRLKNNSSHNIKHLIKIAKIHFAQGDYLKAEKLLEDTLAIDQFRDETRYELGKTKFMLGQLEDSKKLLKDSPYVKQMSVFLNQLGMDMVNKNQFHQAIEHYQASQNIIPDNQNSPFIFFNMALAYFKWDKLNKAEFFIKLALIKNPSYEKAKALLDQIKTQKTAVA